MASIDPDMWPYSSLSKRAAKRIDWLAAEPNAMRLAEPRVIKAVDPADLQKLTTDPRFSSLHDLLTDDCKDMVQMILTGSSKATAGPRSFEGDVKKAVKKELTRVLQEAEAESDYSAQLKALETIGKTEALFSEKKQVDTTINIYVTTGVPRG